MRSGPGTLRHRGGSAGVMITMRTAAIPSSTAVSRVPLMISRRMCQECRAYRGKSEHWKLKDAEPAKVKLGYSMSCARWMIHLRVNVKAPQKQQNKNWKMAIDNP